MPCSSGSCFRFRMTIKLFMELDFDLHVKLDVAD